MRRLIERVRSPQGQPEAAKEALYGLMNAVVHHVADEATLLLPAAEPCLGEERLADLGARMKARHLERARPRAAELATDLVRASPARTALTAVGALVAAAVQVRTLHTAATTPPGHRDTR